MLWVLVLGCLVLSAAIGVASDYPISPVPFTQVRFTGGVLYERQMTNLQVTLPFALKQLETSGRLRNFDLAADVMRRRRAGETNYQVKPPTEYPFDDSDVYKVIEGASYCLSLQYDPRLAQTLEEIIARVAAAQEPDGYLYTFRTMHPDSPGHPWIGHERWEKDPELSHELYNLGHLFEAGVAHYQATGSRSLLDVCIKAAELLWRDFGDGKRKIAPGHQVVEMGLVKLYRVTHDDRWLRLAKFFLDVRGYRNNPYSQDHKPVLEQTEAVGHAVRANYMYCGMADVAALTGDARYFDAITRIWQNVVSCKLHLTGGCGARAAGEAYGDNYELPHRCYNETCAAVAFLFWNHRMFLMTGDAKYMDAFERTLYNGALSGVSLSGDRFFYPNPLEYDGKSRFNHGHAGRAPWFGCACCPPNIMRLLASLGGYMYAVASNRVYVNLFAQSEANVPVLGQKVKLIQRTDYPWSGDIALLVYPERTAEFTLSIRVPCWVEGKPLPSDLYYYGDRVRTNWKVTVNGAHCGAVRSNDGYLSITRRWEPGDIIWIYFPMVPRRVLGNPHIVATRRQVALVRGPVVYAFEGLDNDGYVFDIVLPDSARISTEYRPDFFAKVPLLKVQGAFRTVYDDAGNKKLVRSGELIAIPYAWWANRDRSPMAVWVAEDPIFARPKLRPTLANKAKVSVSFARGGMSLDPINDQETPENAPIGSVANFDFWPRKGTKEWIIYEFTQPVTLRKTRVWWFDDTGIGECRLPAWWQILYKEGEQWKPVEPLDPYRIEKDHGVEVRFKPVTTTAIRLEIQLLEGYSAGVYEWQVE
jgi:DUF1680 family protein